MGTSFLLKIPLVGPLDAVLFFTRWRVRSYQTLVVPPNSLTIKAKAAVFAASQKRRTRSVAARVDEPARYQDEPDHLGADPSNPRKAPPEWMDKSILLLDDPDIEAA
jgi:hypothetical protein